jgi:uncharacterized membrane protein (UPF0136 family)
VSTSIIIAALGVVALATRPPANILGLVGVIAGIAGYQKNARKKLSKWQIAGALLGILFAAAVLMALLVRFGATFWQ